MKILIEPRYSLTAVAEREMFRAVTKKPCYMGADYNTEIKAMADTDKEQTFEFPDVFHDATCEMACENDSNEPSRMSTSPYSCRYQDLHGRH